MFIFNYISPRERVLTNFEDKIRNISIGLSSADSGCIDLASFFMSKLITSDSLRIPIPSSKGCTKANFELAKNIALLANFKCTVLDCLTSNERMSQKIRRQNKLVGLAEKDIITSFKTPFCYPNANIILIDNVRTTGATINSAKKLFIDSDFLVFSQAKEITL